MFLEVLDQIGIGKNTQYQTDDELKVSYLN